MLQTLHSLETAGSYNQAARSIEDSFEDFGDEVKAMSRSDEKNKGIKILNITNKILNFSLKKQKQKGQGLKILTPNQMLSRLLISLAQLKAGNNSEKRKNEIRQLLYSLYRSKKLTKNIYKIGWHYLNMETIFINTENSKTNESNKFIYQFNDKINLKTPN